MLINSPSGNCKTDSNATRRVILYFLLSLIVCLSLSYISIHHRLELQRLSMEQLIAEKALAITEVISKLLYKTEALAALVIQNDGAVGNFDHAASIIMDDPAIRNLVLAPNGMVRHVYPLTGNEGLLGYDLLGEGAGNREAAAALERSALVFGGPFKPVQGGGEVLVGRLPLWLDLPGKGRSFWGLVSVTLNYPEALAGATLDHLGREGFAYEIWRINPDDGKRQVIATSLSDDKSILPYIELPLCLFNAQWHFRIMPVRHWYEFPENWVPLVASVISSLLIALVIRNNERLKTVKRDLASLSRTDLLTGVPSRTGLFQIINKLREKDAPFKIYYCDLDHFKQINDTHGHAVGDKVLMEFCRGINKLATARQTLARIGGDQFILVHEPGAGAGGTEEAERVFWKKVDDGFAEPRVMAGETPVPITYSRGMAEYPKDGLDIDTLISRAGQRMRQNKESKYALQQRRRASDA